MRLRSALLRVRSKAARGFGNSSDGLNGNSDFKGVTNFLGNKRSSYYCTLVCVVLFFLYFFCADSIFPHQRATYLTSSMIKSPPRSPSSSFNVLQNIHHVKLNELETSAYPADRQERILILTPLSRFYDEYWSNLINLKYPHDLIDLGFILPKNREGNAAYSRLQEKVNNYQKQSNRKNRFNKVTILRQDFDTVVPNNEKERHALAVQGARRAVMARARNSLLFTTLDPEILWVLWLDGDIVETPPTLIEDLALHNKDVIAPNVFQRYEELLADGKKEKKIRPYDFNNWLDSEQAQELAQSMGEDDLLLEGYEELPTYRTLMAYQYSSDGELNIEMPLDGVGGGVLLVKAEVHRDGAMFPPFAFYNLIETEGFAKMVKRLNYQAFGLPNYLVYHYNE